MGCTWGITCHITRPRCGAPGASPDPRPAPGASITQQVVTWYRKQGVAQSESVIRVLSIYRTLVGDPTTGELDERLHIFLVLLYFYYTLQVQITASKSILQIQFQGALVPFRYQSYSFRARLYRLGIYLTVSGRAATV